MKTPDIPDNSYEQRQHPIEKKFEKCLRSIRIFFSDYFILIHFMTLRSFFIPVLGPNGQKNTIRIYPENGIDNS